ncbi:GNAT family N-acetyltransferase [Paraglaciecola sp.]|uniref:GNAT family N-acetyltransferase n=1 Tax=Paraglaciecola sp. TaxID=1920173 RepID=UPI003EF1EC60
MHIRRAEQDDANILASLVYASASSLLNASFNLNPRYTAQGFLSSSLVNPEGQYGYKNHWVMIHKEQTIACVSGWHNDMPAEIQQATLRTIVDYFGLDNGIQVLKVNQAVRDCIPEILVHEWCVGHLSVDQKYQCQGVATALLKLMQTQALSHNKTHLSLDVEASNQKAIEFYLNQGFTQVSESKLTANMLKLGVGRHLHLTRPLTS